MAATRARHRPRFRRAATPPPFRLTDQDVEIVRLLGRHRFLRSTHIADLVGRSLDRTNDRLSRLFHAAYIDRPRAQLDYYPSSGSAPMVYALADRGARLLIARDGITLANVEWSRKNREAGRPFIEHQLDVMDFYVALERAGAARGDLCILHRAELVAAVPDQSCVGRNPFALRGRIVHQGVAHDVAVIPDLTFGLKFHDGTRRCFMVEIDRGTMPVLRSDFAQTSFDRKMRAYLSAYAAKQHERQLGWKAFRVLTVTSDVARKDSIMAALHHIRVPNSPGPSLFLFSTRDELLNFDPLTRPWQDGHGRNIKLT